MNGGVAMLPFVKMEGAGNDYVHVDALRTPFDEGAAAELARAIADRHFGVGGDGLIVLAASARADVRMVMWNADGSRGAMCGNGLRCLAKLAADHGHVTGDSLVVETDAGLRAVTLLRDPGGAITGARVEMGEVRIAEAAETVELGGRTWRLHRGDAGNPHAVVFVDEDPEAAPVLELGAALQRDPRFPDGVNVELVRVDADGGLSQRTFERGSGETLACGSGATVAAVAAVRTGRLTGPRVAVRLRGGVLVIEVDGAEVVMEGPARTVFHGTWPVRGPHGRSRGRG